MPHAAVLTAPVPAATRRARWCAWWRARWHALTLDDDERFVRNACDLADLERRLRCLERGRADAWRPVDPCP